MNDAQTWTVIGGMLAILASQTALVLRVVRIQLDGVNTRVDGVEKILNVRVDSLESGLNARVDGLEKRLGDKLDNLDRDVQRLVEDKFKP